jgi:hypothetical protein
MRPGDAGTPHYGRDSMTQSPVPASTVMTGPPDPRESTSVRGSPKRGEFRFTPSARTTTGYLPTDRNVNAEFGG